MSTILPAVCTGKHLPILVCLLVSWTLASPRLPAQPFSSLDDAEESLSQQFTTATTSTEDAQRLDEGERFCDLFRQVLLMKGSLEHPFTLLPKISKLTAGDKTMRIYTWNIPLHSGENRFYGFIQLRTGRQDSFQVVRLTDRGDEISSPEYEILLPDNWYGAIYYDLIRQKTQGNGVLFTLLGWRGEDLLTTSRVIEILTIDDAGQPRFGQLVFCGYGGTRPARILFRHGSGVSMTLTYDEQWLVAEKQWNRKKKEFEVSREKLPMIVCDRLVPGDPQLEGQPEYYVPAGNILDGFVFRNNCWEFVEEVDARNP